MNDRENTAIQFAADKIGINREKFSEEVSFREYWPPKWTWTENEKGRLTRIDIVFENEKETFGLSVGIDTSSDEMWCWELSDLGPGTIYPFNKGDL